jgi:tRNA(Met) C34 N-acetyltransferase TmcA
VLTVRVRVTGTSWADAKTLAKVLQVAVSQLSYTATVVAEGDAETYECEPADVEWTQPSRARVAAGVVDLTLTIPVQPT